LKSKRPKSHH